MLFCNILIETVPIFIYFHSEIKKSSNPCLLLCVSDLPQIFVGALGNTTHRFLAWFKKSNKFLKKVLF